MAMQGRYSPGKALISLVKGDITTIEADVIVNSANSSLMGAGGVDGAIHRAGGSKILEECKQIRKTQWPEGLPTGEVVITSGGNLKVKYIIHTVGPVWRGGFHKESELLAKAYQNSMKVAVSRGMRSIAFPSISTGRFGYPIEEAGKIALFAVKKFLERESTIDTVFFVLYSSADFETYSRFAEEIFNK